MAPDVPADTAAKFTLTATGIQGTSSSETTVNIKDVNRAPTAAITGNTTVKAKETASLSGSTSSDPDGDTLTYAWSQTSGPPVTLNGATSANVSFTAPDNSGNIGIELTVTDPKAASASASTTINVNKSSGGCTSTSGSPLPLLALLALGVVSGPAAARRNGRTKVTDCAPSPRIPGVTGRRRSWRRGRSPMRCCATLLFAGLLQAASARAGPESLAVQVLGSGGPRPSAQASSGTLVLVDGVARILVDAGPGTLLRAGERRVISRPWTRSS